MIPPEFGFFDPKQELNTSQRRLPHWEQAGATYYITSRTADSLPRSVLENWNAECRDRLERLGVYGTEPWRELAARLPAALKERFRGTTADSWNDLLDAGHGAYPVRDPACAKVVAGDLHHGHGTRYSLAAFVVMPNHVHVLAAFPMAEGAVKTQCGLWKRWTGRRINALLSRRGEFWQVESFDRMVRGPEGFVQTLIYIADNPVKANLRPGEFLHWERPGLRES